MKFRELPLLCLVLLLLFVSCNRNEISPSAIPNYTSPLNLDAGGGENAWVPWLSRDMLKQADFDAEHLNRSQNNFRLIDLSGYPEGGVKHYSGIWDCHPGPAQKIDLGLTPQDFDIAFLNNINSMRIQTLDVTSINGNPAFSVIWDEVTSPDQFVKFGLKANDYQAAADQAVLDGLRLKQVCGYRENGQTLYAAVWDEATGPDQVTFHGYTSQAYQTLYDGMISTGYKLVDVDAYPSGSGYLIYAGIFEEVQTNDPIREARHGMSLEEYKDEFDKFYYDGYKLIKVDGHRVNGGKLKFTAIWENEGLPETDRNAIDATITGFMGTFAVHGLSIAIMKDDRLIMAKGYGNARDAGPLVMHPKHQFRIASISKPITAVAIMQLVESGQLNLSDQVFGTGGILGTTYGNTPYPSNFTAITVQNLLEHNFGGWSINNNYIGDPTASSFDKASLLDWCIDTDLPFITPGILEQYSNIGYLVLGLVIEEVTGVSYEFYVNNNVLNQCDLLDMHIGQNAKTNFGPNEVYYYSNGGSNPYAMKMQRMDAHGGWVASPIEMCKFLAHVDGISEQGDILLPSTITAMQTQSSATTPGPNGGPANQALGWQLGITNERIRHGGALNGLLTELVLFDNGVAVCIMANTQVTGMSLRFLLDNDVNAIETAANWPTYNRFYPY